MLSICAFNTIAVDVVTVNVGESETDKRILFKNELVRQALEITKEEYGEYKIVANPMRMNINRAFRELEIGTNLSLTFAHTRKEFEDRAFPVRVPIRQGVDAYRLLVVKKGRELLFESIESLDDLKKLRVGLSPAWATYKIMKDEGFDIVDAPVYKTMYNMLELERFDYIPRAINEIYDEIELYKPRQDGLAIVPGIALHIPSTSYMFVSHKQPRIYQRLNSGLHAMNLNGDLSALTDKFFKTSIKKAALQNRRIFSLNNEEFNTVVKPIEQIVTPCTIDNLSD
ncbi:transporter substrate-binding domain-containing protein [Glaciecola sp. MH2013]|uniref:transporter substrate-binding domain-containing protein n=1 Tax=Glaciecola sp. MH2013 TaxID=2785524 RepID=UPI00189DFDA8|nr:transporter substrate-binding domain-containing protein [Glaciecola sp. MH2013]MBF7074957.1 transporter substrate-binding domain-containing protein [Glaciecola sp. MH2013]